MVRYIVKFELANGSIIWPQEVMNLKAEEIVSVEYSFENSVATLTLKSMQLPETDKIKKVEEEA